MVLDLPVSTLLPTDARWALIDASALPTAKGRVEAIDAAIARIKAQYPQFFRSEQELLK